jgi:hypothetical protein
MEMDYLPVAECGVEQLVSGAAQNTLCSLHKNKGQDVNFKIICLV